MNRIWRALRGWASGGPERLATQPLIAGYRRSVKPGWTMLGILTLAIACFAYGLSFSILAPAVIMPFTVPLALLAGLVVWGLPAGTYAPTRALEPLYFAFFVALMLWPNYLAIGLPGLPWVTLLRLIVVPLILVFLVCLSASPAFRRKFKDVITTDRILLFLMIALIGLQTLSLVFSSSLADSVNHYLIAQMNWSAVFFIGAVVFVRRGFAEHWATTFLVAATVLCAIAVWEVRIGHVPWAGHVPSIFKIEDELVLKILTGAARSATKVYRAQATATTPLSLAELLGLAVPFAIHLAVSRYPIALRAFALAFLPLSIWVILLTDSRLGVVAALASVMVYVLVWSLGRWVKDKNSMIAPALAMTYPASFVAAVAATFFVGRLRQQVWGDGSQAASDESRMQQWSMGIPKILSNPVGHGTGRSGETLGFVDTSGLLTIDSYYLSVLLDLGVLGFVVYYGLFLRAAWTAAKITIFTNQEREVQLLLPMAVAMVNFVVVKAVLSQEANHPLMFIMLGAVVGLAFRAKAARAAGAA